MNCIFVDSGGGRRGGDEGGDVWRRGGAPPDSGPRRDGPPRGAPPNRGSDERWQRGESNTQPTTALLSMLYQHCIFLCCSVVARASWQLFKDIHTQWKHLIKAIQLLMIIGTGICIEDPQPCLRQ